MKGLAFELETERLRLRPLKLDDVDALHRVLGDAETMKWYPAPFTREETLEWIQRWLDSYQQRGHGLWVMELKSSGEVIGDVGLTVQIVDQQPFIEVGWHTRRDLWGQGYATEGGRASVQWGFDNLDVDRIISLIRPENVASSRVAEKLGLKVWRETMRGPNNSMFHHVYAITRKEWESAPH